MVFEVGVAADAAGGGEGCENSVFAEEHAGVCGVCGGDGGGKEGCGDDFFRGCHGMDPVVGFVLGSGGCGIFGFGGDEVKVAGLRCEWVGNRQ